MTVVKAPDTDGQEDDIQFIQLFCNVLTLLLNRFPVTASAESPESFNNFGGSNVPLGKRVRILKYRVHQMCMNLTAGRLNKMTPLAVSNS